jgi:26S proteasome regulatory subunit N5
MDVACVQTVQIYVEVERARLVRQLVKIKEETGDIQAAADLIQEVAVRFTGS